MAAAKTGSHSLSTEERKEFPETEYAFPEERKEPLNDASHVRNAIARFDQVKGVSAAEKKTAFKKIETAAKKFGVDMSSTPASEPARKGPAKKGPENKGPENKSAKKAAK